MNYLVLVPRMMGEPTPVVACSIYNYGINICLINTALNNHSHQTRIHPRLVQCVERAKFDASQPTTWGPSPQAETPDLPPIGEGYSDSGGLTVKFDGCILCIIRINRCSHCGHKLNRIPIAPRITEIRCTGLFFLFFLLPVYFRFTGRKSEVARMSCFCIRGQHFV